MTPKSPDKPTRPKDDRAGRPRLRRAIIGAVIAVLLVAYVATGFYVVQPSERAVVRRFGAVVNPQAAPGVHYCLPRPFGRADILKTTEPRRVVVGFHPDSRAAIAAGDVVAMQESTRSDVFTGDVNIVKATMIARYQIAKPDRYLLASAQPDDLVRLAVLSAMIETLGGYSIDDALTEGRARLENAVREQAQAMLADYGCGIALEAVDLNSIEPPQAIADAFRDVTSAKKDQEKDIDAAHAFADSLLPRARGKAAEELAAARGYTERTVNKAKGQTERFNAVLAEYRKAPEVTRLRLLIDTLTTVYERAETYILTSDPDGPPLRLTIGEKKK